MFTFNLCQFAVALCFLTLALSSPGATFMGTENAIYEDSLPRGAFAMRKAFLKYGADPPFAFATRGTTSGSVQASPTQYDETYLLPVAIGSPATTYSMSLDTGSSNTSVYAPKLGTSGSVTTTVNIGGLAVRLVVELNNDASGSSNYVGMSYSGNSFFASAVKQLASPVFTSILNKGAPGTYDFGYINTASYTGSVTYVTADTSEGFWQFSSNGYAIGAGAFKTLTIVGIVDTGTTLLLLPGNLVAAYYKQVSGAMLSSLFDGYVFPCSATLPNLVIGINGYMATVPGNYLNYAPVNSSTCYGGLQSSSGIGFSIFGLVFIKSQFIVFKEQGPTLGFAKKV